MGAAGNLTCVESNMLCLSSSAFLLQCSMRDEGSVGFGTRAFNFRVEGLRLRGFRDERFQLWS